MANVKVNVVLMGGTNDDELTDFVDFAEAEDVEVRFIEHMPMDAARVGRWHVDPRRVIRELAATREVEPLPARRDGGPAERFRVGGARIGFIHAMSNPFCDRCNRLRITSEGTIRSCLLSGGEVDLKGAIRRGGPAHEIDDAIEALIREAADAKPPIYDLHQQGEIAMRSIGG
jgi:cyclic pyranopterin phosphate synthase